jgi:hypothetical protein
MARPFALAVLLLAFGASAAAPDYERRLVQWALDKTGRVPEPMPDGKVVEEVLVASEEIFSESDPFPGFLNVFHWLTRENVVRREVLLAVGAPYDAELAAETERILRSRYIYAVAKVVAVQGRAGGVALLVVTKDRWSLRLNSDFRFVGTLLQYLRLWPTEQNFLGHDQQVNLRLFLELDTLQLGQRFDDRRLFGSRLSFTENATIVLNRETLAAEGSNGGVGLGRELFTLDDTWRLWGDAAWDVRTVRNYRGAAVWQLDDGNGGAVPWVYERRAVGGKVLYTRSFGHENKTNLSAGAGAYSHQYRAPPSAPLSDDQRAFLEATAVPRSEDAVYLYAELKFYEARYRVVHDVDTFSLSEDVRLGFRAVAQARWANPAFFSPSRFLESGVAVGYRLLANDDLASFAASGSVRAQGGWVNRRFAAEVTNASPSLGGFGRVVARAMVDLRADDLDHLANPLNAGNGLRGASAVAIDGPSIGLWNLELRTRAVEFQTVYVGLVFFWDSGADLNAAPVFTHTLGAGLRILLPQFNQETIRIDFGMVLGGPSPSLVNRFSGGYGQVTDYRPASLDSPL